MPLMPAIVAALLTGLIQIASTLAGRVLVALGFGVATYTGLNTSLSWLKSQAVAAFANSQFTPEVLGMVSQLKVGECISIISSALIVRQVLNGLSAGGSISKLIKK